MANIKGKQLMVATMENGLHTIAYATSHTFQIGSNLDDTSTKDDNDLYVNQEITSQNWSLTTENLIAQSLDDEGSPSYEILLAHMKKQQDLTVIFGSLPGAMGKERQGTDWITGDGVATTELWRGIAHITSLELNAGNRENVSYTATFTGYGAPLSYATTSLNAEVEDGMNTLSAKKSKKSETTETAES